MREPTNESNVVLFPGMRAIVHADEVERVPEDGMWKQDSKEMTLRAELETIQIDDGHDEKHKLRCELMAVRNRLERQGMMEEWMDNLLRIRLRRRGVNVYFLTLPELRFAVTELREIAAEIDRFESEVKSAVWHMKMAFSRQVVGRGLPWTPSIKRKYGEIPDGEVDWLALHAELMDRAKEVQRGRSNG